MLRTNHAPSRGRKTKDPCPGCALHKSLCICALTPRLELRTRLTLVVHAKELKRTTNSGRLAARALINSEIIVRGLGPIPIPLWPGYRPLLLFPGEGVRELTSEMLTDEPVQLIVPDGNWRQAAKVGTRHPELHAVERVGLSQIPVARDGLRRETTPYGLSTLEAVARALRVIEGETVYQRLNDFYLAKLKATLIGRSGGALVEGCQARDLI